MGTEQEMGRLTGTAIALRLSHYPRHCVNINDYQRWEVHRIESTILYAATITAVVDDTANARSGRENGQRGVGQQSSVNGEQPLGLDLGSRGQWFPSSLNPISSLNTDAKQITAMTTWMANSTARYWAVFSHI